jgi:hypothetical protein
MRPASSALLAASILLALAGTARAQITWDTGSVTGITGASDISTLGEPVDALGANAQTGSAITVGDTTFNPFLGSDTGITISGAVGLGTDGSGATSPAYDKVLDDVAYANTGDTGTVTFNSSILVAGDTYQVEIWNDGGRPTEFTGANTVELSGEFALGTFTAGSGSESFTFYTDLPNNAGEFDAVALRLVPEPSTYAMMIGGLALLGFCIRRKGTLSA